MLSHDPLWPRAGDWPAWAPGSRADAVLVGIPTWRTALSPGQAHTTPAAIRDALRSYTADALLRIPTVDRSLVVGDVTSDRNERPIDGSSDTGATPAGERLVVLDAGDVPEPDGAGEAAATARVAELASSASLVIVLGGDNAATVPAALGAWGARIGTAGLVTLDAHHDLRDGTTNGSPVRRLLEAGLAGERTSQLGIEALAGLASRPGAAA